MNKNRFNSGESMIETLVAVLIVTLSSVMLIMSISTATKLNQQASSYEGRFDWEYNYASKTIAKKDGKTLTGELDKGSVVLDIEGGNKVKQNVIWCGGKHIGSYIPGETN